jgi:hypothetical protein
MFPRGFYMLNAYLSGTVDLSSLNPEEGWSTAFTVEEHLFNIQQLLAHPNPNIPAQGLAYMDYAHNRPEYLRRLGEQCAAFSRTAPDQFLAKACEHNLFTDAKVSGEELSLVHDPEPALPAAPARINIGS